MFVYRYYTFKGLTRNCPKYINELGTKFVSTELEHNGTNKIPLKEETHYLFALGICSHAMAIATTKTITDMQKIDLRTPVTRKD